MTERTIVSLCDGTGAWSQPYVDAGYRVIRVSLPDGDVHSFVPPPGVHGVLAAPPCTEFALSGARWWKDKDPQLLADAIDVVRACLRIIAATKPAWWALENPVGRLVAHVPELGKPRLSFNPCDYGDPYTKRTLVWGDFRPPFKGALVEATEGSKMHKIGPGPRRQELRSITPPGFARAFFEANP